MIETALILALLTVTPEQRISLDYRQNSEVYLALYFETFPTQALAAGAHHHDPKLETLDPEERDFWIAQNRHFNHLFRAMLDGGDLTSDQRLDTEFLLAETERQIFAFETLRRPERDPLFWSQILSNATVLLLVRDDRPAVDRLNAAASRAAHLPRLAKQAEDALRSGEPDTISAELTEIAAAQIRASARFYRDGFAGAAADVPTLVERLRQTGHEAADALDHLADFLDGLAKRATGSPRLGEHYARSFALGTGIDTPVADVLARAEQALAAKRAETTAFGRGLWPSLFPEEPAPVDDREVVRRLFARIAEDRVDGADPEGTTQFVEEYRQLIADAIRFVKERQLIEFPDPFPLRIDRSPEFFVGQSVGGVYPAGPFHAQSPTLLFVPTPPDDLPAEARDAFFRDFNHHFNVMILPHEIVPGHALQLAVANRQASAVRALFGDGVYVEGWGTFCERLMLDLGWGTPLARAAHLKKQLENIARTIVDIRVHAYGMTADEAMRFVRDDAFQDEQFAKNMWRRAITSSPQLTTYFLGFDQLWTIYQDARRTRGESFDLPTFLREMMELGAVSPEQYRRSLGLEP